ncbi:MAG TPA: tetratricopeptide repeat protein [Planctomycetota bacterium]|nr:tetratricopeptide repeat protein [Planctomycetota bacterium]
MTELGPYRLLREIGSGGMARVHLAEDKEGNRVALKVVYPHLAEDPAFRRRFRREGELGRRIRHRNVVSTLDVGEADEAGKPALYLALEYVEGQTLRGLLEELERVPEELCRHIGREAAKGLAAVHAAGAVHRDLKPENILITPDHIVKVSDLGVARLVEGSHGSTEPGAFAGTVLYAAPEQFGGDHDARGDLYALGLVLYELATGAHPFGGDDAVGIMGRHMNETPRPAGELNPQLSAFFEELLRTLLEKDPGKRIPTATALAELLREGEASAWWKERARAIRESTRRPLRRPRVPRETALVGRDDEIARLRAAYDRAAAGDGRVVLVEGEAGIGKTRLCDEFVAGLAAAGEEIHYLFGSYLPGEAATASGAFSTAYREQMGADTAVARYLRDLPLLVPAFSALLRGEPPPPGAVPLTKESLQAVFVEATRSLAAERPTVLLIDDLQFAPAEGRALLMSLAIAAAPLRVLLLVTARPGLSEAWLAELERMPHASRIQLPRLGAKQLARLLVEAFRSEQLAEELGFRIAQKSDGNPFFVFEIIRGLREGRLLARKDDGTWVRSGVIEGIQIPSSVRDLIQARMADLDPLDRDLLEVASCCGFEFDPTLVAEASGVDLIGALRRFGQIERRHRLIRSAGRRCVFDHHQVQETLYAGLLPALRERYHLAIGDALERKQGGAGGAGAVALCEHFLKSTEPGRSRPYLDRAVSQLERDYGADAPANVARLALAAPGLLAGRDRAGMLLRFASNLDLSGKREEQRSALDEALGIARNLSDPGLGARAVGMIGSLFLHTGRFEEARRAIEEALDLARKAGDRRQEAHLCGGMGVTLYDTGRGAEALPWHERQLAIARETGDRHAEADAINNIGNVHRVRRDRQQARAYYEQYLALARELGLRGAEAMALGNLGHMAHDEGDIDEARRLHREQLALARSIGHRRTEARALGALAIDAKHLGLLDEAEATYERYIALSREIDHRVGVAYGRVNLARLLGREGDFDRARALLGEADAFLSAVHPAALGTLLEILGEVEEAALRPDEARRCYEDAVARHARASNEAGRASAQRLRGALDGDAEALDEAKAAAERLGILDVALEAACARAALPGGDVAAAVAAYGEEAPRLSILSRMDVAFDLYRLTGDPRRLDDAAAMLRKIEEHVPAGRRGTWRAHPRQARILASLPPRPPSS